MPTCSATPTTSKRGATPPLTRWWACIELDPWDPRHETVQRLPVPPDRVLATLSWRAKAIAARLLDAAVEHESHFAASWHDERRSG